MKSTSDLTTYALGNLPEDERKELLEKLLSSGLTKPEIDEEVSNLKHIETVLNSEFQKDEMLRLDVEKRESLFPKKNFITWKKIMLGLSLSFAGVFSFVIIKEDSLDSLMGTTYTKSPELVGNLESGQESYSMARSSARSINKGSKRKELKKIGIAPQPTMMDMAASEEFNRENYEKVETNPYTLVLNQPLSTFSVDVDTASYANMRRFLMRGSLPPKDSIRVEELINYFGYQYDVDFNNHPVGIKVDQSISPWNKNRKLVRVALKADSPSKLTQARKNLVFLLDVSGSMNAPKKLPLLVDSIKLMVRKLRPTDTISVITYAGASGVVLKATEASEKIKIFKALQSLRPSGGTNGEAGIKGAYKIAKENYIKDGVNRVILATDGDFNVGVSSDGDLVRLIEEKAKENIFLTVVGLGMGNFQDALLEKISNKGNGNYAYIDSLQEANKLFNVDLEKNLTTVAKDVKVQVEFNPNKIKAYRLIGYENRLLAAQDFNNDKKDAGEMGAGHTVTALYEVILPDEEIEASKIDDLKYQNKTKAEKNDSNELLTVKVRYKNPTEDKSTKFDVVLNDSDQAFKSMDSDFRFAAAVASFGMKLRDDNLVNELRYKDISSMASEAKGSDPYRFREEFIELIDFAKQIDK